VARRGGQAPERGVDRGGLAMGLHNLGNLLNRYDAAAAFDKHQEALNLRLRLASENPAVLEHRIDVAQSRSNLYYIAKKLNRQDDAARFLFDCMVERDKIMREGNRPSPKWPSNFRETRSNSRSF